MTLKSLWSLASALLAVTVLLAVAGPAHARDNAPGGDTVSKKSLEDAGYTCEYVATDFWECTKTGEKTYWCSDHGKACVPKPRVRPRPGLRHGARPPVGIHDRAIARLAGVHDRETWVESGEWRTLATLWNTSATGAFRLPAGARIRVRYGGGWFAKNRQRQTLDGVTEKYLRVGKGWSLFVARMQIKVPTSTVVTWKYITEGPEPQPRTPFVTNKGGEFQ